MSSRPWLLALMLSCSCHVILPLTTKEDSPPTDSTPGVENHPSLEGLPVNTNTILGETWLMTTVLRLSRL